MDLSDPEVRVLGCLVEKQVTTPAHYPMTVNALVAACNQATNRWPVVAYDEAVVEEAIQALRERGLVRTVRVPGQRSIKHRHVLDEILDLTTPGLSVLAVLMLRGPQTPGELRARTVRYHDFAGLDGVEQVLAELIEANEPLLERLERRPGEKETRYRHLLGGGRGHGPVPEGEEGIPAPTRPASLDARIEAVEAAVADLRSRLDALADALGVRPPGF